MRIREEAEGIRPIYKDLLVLGGEMTTGLISRQAILSILDQWECVAEGTIWEPKEGASQEYPEALYLQTESALAPLIRILMHSLRPGDTVSIYVRRKDERTSKTEA